MMPIPAFFEFECPVKTHCGHRALDHMPFELRAMDVAKPLLIGDAPASHAKRWHPVVNAFRDAQMTIGVVEEHSHGGSTGGCPPIGGYLSGQGL